MSCKLDGKTADPAGSAVDQDARDRMLGSVKTKRPEITLLELLGALAKGRWASVSENAASTAQNEIR